MLKAKPAIVLACILLTGCEATPSRQYPYYAVQDTIYRPYAPLMQLMVQREMVRLYRQQQRQPR